VVVQELSHVAVAVGAALAGRGERVAVSESSSGGLVSAALLSVPGASAWYRGGAVAYTGEARAAFLGLPAALPEAVRSASPPYAALCARIASERLGAEWGLAETGAAGPAGNRYGDAPGHCCVAVWGVVQSVRTLDTGLVDRQRNMWAFALAALEELHACLGRAGR
jgi:PncC family amidohydrolase